MPTTTDETTAINGTILNTLAYNFAGFGDRLDGATMRGTNNPVPLGADSFRPHWYGPRVEQWEMWVSSHDPTTDTPGGRAQAMANLDAIKALFQGNPNVPLTVTRIVRLPSVGLQTRTATALCRRISTRAQEGGAFIRVTVEVEIPAGVWLGAAGSGNTTGTLTVGGTAMIVPTLITFTGAATTTNTTTGTGFVYSGPAATLTPASWSTSPADAISALFTTNGQVLTLAPGANVFTGTSVAITWTEAYL